MSLDCLEEVLDVLEDNDDVSDKSDCSGYSVGLPDIVKAFKERFYSFIDTAFENKVISKQTWDFICVPYPRIATFYALPKIHKNTKNPPGRPILSGNGAITENLSGLIDEHIRPFVLTIPSYVRDTIHLLQIIEGVQVSEQCILASIDVEALYSSIPHHEGLACIFRLLSQMSDHEVSFNEFILMSLDFILHHNIFSLDGRLFLQVQGVAMDTCCAPGYANLYLGELERTIFSEGSPPLECL